MASTGSCADLLSTTERTFLVRGILDSDIRLDGRSSHQRRTVNVEMGAVPQALGSARVILLDSFHPSDVIVAIKGDLKPTVRHPSILQDPDELFRVTVESGGVSYVAGAKASVLEERNARIARWLSSVLQSSVGVRALQVEASGGFTWGLRVEVLIVSELGGALLDVIGEALNAALRHCKLPAVIVEKGSDVGNEGISLDESKGQPLCIATEPFFMELGCLAPGRVLCDMSVAERNCCGSAFWVALDAKNRKVLALETAFCSELPSQSVLSEALTVALSQAHLSQSMAASDM